MLSNDSQPADKEATPVPIDHFDGVLSYLNQMLMEEEELEHRPGMFQDSLSLQAAEKSFYDVLGQQYPPSNSPNQPNILQFSDDCSRSSSSSAAASNCLESNSWVQNQGEREQILGQPSSVDYSFQSSGSSRNSCHSFDIPSDFSVNPFQFLDSSGNRQNVFQLKGKEEGKTTHSFQNNSHVNDGAVPNAGTMITATDHSPNDGSGRKKISHHQRDSGLQEERTNKHLASCADEESEESTLEYDKVLLCPAMNPGLHHDCVSCPCGEASQSRAWQKLQQSKPSNRGRPSRYKKKQGNIKEVVDLISLLTQCAQALASHDSVTANLLLNRIKQHCSPYGDATERMAHYFCNAVEARLAGTGMALYIASGKISAADILKSCKVYYTACPFRRMSNIFANKSIGRVSRGATRLHIIDFGILYGFQWPCIIQGLSLRPGRPPRLRITGIDLPQPGFRPAERVEETGRRLADYCRRFNLPFEYNAIAKKWDTIQIEDLKIDRDEVLLVNCLYRMRNVPDDSVMADGPRNKVLNLIKSINPDMFLHGVVNGSYNATFFVNRFREAVFHYSALFDMLDATVPREDQERLMFERGVFGREAMNVIACEGTQRVERPETYKQWQTRNQRAGFRQLPLYKDIVEEVRTKVKLSYHKDFVVDEDGYWLLQGWKGRVIYALSCWKPA